MLSKIPPQAKPLVAILGLIAAAILIFLSLRGEKTVLDPIVLDISSGRIATMPHRSYTTRLGKQGNDRTLFLLEATGDGGLQIHRRMQGEQVLSQLSSIYNIPLEQFHQYFDPASDSTRPRIKDDLVPGWARSLPATEAATRRAAPTEDAAQEPAPERR